MTGKFFASTFSGSMFGAGPHVFAVWGYVIAHCFDSEVELNPPLLAAMLGSSPAVIEEAIAYLTAPDPRSRNPEADGRRLVHQGGFTYRVTTHAHYQKIRDAEARRAYNREAVARHRAKSKAVGGIDFCNTDGNLHVSDVTDVSPRRRRRQTQTQTQTTDTETGLDRNKEGERAREFVEAEDRSWVADYDEVDAAVADDGDPPDYTPEEDMDDE